VIYSLKSVLKKLQQEGGMGQLGADPGESPDGLAGDVSAGRGNMTLGENIRALEN